MDTLIYKAGILIEALPYISSSVENGNIKYGSSAAINDDLNRTIMQDITLKYVGVNPP